MSHTPIDGLLQASLSQNQPKRPMYSVTAHALVAFFGGPIALTLFSAMSIRHIGLLRQHVVYYVLLFIALLGLTGLMGYWMATGWPNWLAIASNDGRSFRLVNRILALALFGVIYLFQRHYFSISHFHEDQGNPWVPAIIAGVIGMGIQLGILYVIGSAAK